MLDVEYEILSEFSDGVPRGIEGLSPVERAAFEHLISAGYLEKVVVTPDNNVGHFLRAWCITSNGLFALQEFEHKIQCDAEKKAQEEWDRLQAETTAIKNRRNNLHSADHRGHRRIRSHFPARSSCGNPGADSSSCRYVVFSIAHLLGRVRAGYAPARSVCICSNPASISMRMISA